jgi:hypothetical protein
MLTTVWDALTEAGPRDISSQKDKKNYAERFSRALATVFANALRPTFKAVIPDAEGRQQESPARTAKGVKKLDVNHSTPELGLGLGVSIKTLNFPDSKAKRFTKNFTRIDNELRAEAKDYHERQPYAVMIAVVFLPISACVDGGKASASSFGSAVRLFRHRAGRASPDDEQELFERIFVALYDPNVETEAFLALDVMNAPPKNGPPKDGVRFDAVVAEIVRTYDARNNPKFTWADD